jgi:predicted AlkP superfamily phosphohydrolase/phosphomutase
MKKTIVIGLDGFDPKIVERLLDSGELPFLAKLRAEGGYSRVRTTYPAQTPVAWSTFATGVNPGGHGVFDFIRRDPKTYLPELSFNRYVQKNAFLPPKAINLRRGIPIWRLLTEAGLPSTLVRFPCTYPPDEIYGRMLSGMGVPDLRGGQGTSTFYSSKIGVKARESENVVPVTIKNHTIDAYLIGPRDPKTGAGIGADISIHLDQPNNTVFLKSEGHPKLLKLEQGKWSDWLKVKFKTGFLQSARGMARFYLISKEPVFELYASPINFDPDAPLFPISWPHEYARELSSKLGTFYTTGMVEDHNGLNNGRIGEDAFLAQCELALRERENMMTYELERASEGLFFCLFDTPDRIQHMFWRDGVEERISDAIGDHYRACDAIVGRAMRYVDDQTLLIVLSDHGMNSFERGFNLNTWLHDQGLLALKSGFKPGAEAGDFLQSVDWSRTSAYALGLSGIYLNLKGREEQGVVELGEAANLKSRLVQALSGLGDPERDRMAIRSVMTREQLFAGEFAGESPDLLVNYSGGYRVSWGTSLGGVPEKQFEDNLKKWSGDHLIDPELVPGVLFMNRPFRGNRASLADLAPTILAALNAPKGEAMEGESLLR